MKDRFFTVAQWQTELSKTMDSAAVSRHMELIEKFGKTFGTDCPVALFSAPGRTEIGGNHTDHQRGCVLAASVNLDTVAAVAENGTNVIRIQSEGYPMCKIDLSDLTVHGVEKNTTMALIRGVAAKFAEMGAKLGGFDAYVISDVLRGSGLSSSAAFEVLVGVILNALYFDGKATAIQIAQIGQYAENVYFGKPSGLMDQMASSVGNLVAIDFADPEKPVVSRVDFDFSKAGYGLCIIDSGANHANLTDEYAAIPIELKALCKHFGKSVLREIPEADFYAAIPELRKKVGDRAVLRAIHFYGDNARVPKQVKALQDGDFATFLNLMKDSGRSSWMYLQNVIPAGYKEHQDMAIALALCEKLLDGKGAYRVHGGGFAGTVQAFVPNEMLDGFRASIEAVLGEGSCHILSIRPVGGTQL